MIQTALVLSFLGALVGAASPVDLTARPTAFVFEYGKGRVFQPPLGHDATAIRGVGTTELVRGAVWAAGREISTSAEERQTDVDARDRLLKLGCLDVTGTPYFADATGASDSTQAIQRAVNDARDRGLVCFFPEGTYLISATISCEQQVSKLDTPRHVDGGTEHYWPVHRPMVLMGSTKGKRPVLKLAKDAKGFDDPSQPKMAVWIWAQTWFDRPDKEEPQWGKEQPNISFNHIFKGIDIDVRGHAGAIGIRHSGSQGSTLQDSTIAAEGAYAGMSDCCGQGGGTYNIEVIGGQYGIVIDPESRFPILTACTFKGQTNAAIRYAQSGSQVPTLLVGCLIEPAGNAAIDMTTERSYAGISLVDCVVSMKPGSVVVKTRKDENLFLEDTYVRGAETISSRSPPVPSPADWTRIERYSSHTDQGVNLVNGDLRPGRIVQWDKAAAGPSYEMIRRRHYSRSPSFEDDDAVNVKSFGAQGDAKTDDTAAFAKAIAAHDKLFVPKGNYLLSGSLQLRAKTHLFGLAQAFASIGGVGSARGSGRRGDESDSFSLVTLDDAEAAPGLSFLTIHGRIAWRCGRGTCMLAPGVLVMSGNGGGRLYGVEARGGPLIIKGITQPTAFYALDVERITVNPQSEIKDCANLRLYYFKVEAGTIQRANAGDGNTPCRISGSHDVRIYCMYGNVRQLVNRPMLDVVNSDDIVVSQLKAFQGGEFPHLTEWRGENKSEIPSTRTGALFVRRPKQNLP